MNLIEYADREQLALDLAAVLADDLEAALHNQETAVLAVPGGTSPAPIFDSLCAVARLEWSRVRVMLTDERWVPETSERSNSRLIKQHLLTDAAAAARFVNVYVEGQTPEEAAGPVSEGLEALMPISVLLLGMGADMHTASLFPGAKGLAAGLADDAPVLVPIAAEGQEPRISLSAPALNGAVAKHLVIYGNEKREALARAQTLPPEEAPIAAVLDDMTIHWAG